MTRTAQKKSVAVELPAASAYLLVSIVDGRVFTWLNTKDRTEADALLHGAVQATSKYFRDTPAAPPGAKTE